MAYTIKCSGLMQHLRNGLHASRNGLWAKQGHIGAGPIAPANFHKTRIASCSVPFQLKSDDCSVARRSFSKSSHADPKSSTVHQVGFVIPYQHSELMRNEQLFAEVSNDVDKRALTVKWDDGQVQDYPYVWLRDNCRCEDCFHPQAFCRSFSLPELDVNIRPSQFCLSQDHEKMELQWEDGHTSRYNATWLHQYRFDQSQPDLTLDSKPLYWDSNLGEFIEEFDLEELLVSDKCLYDWLLQMKIVGAALVKARPMEGEVPRIGERLSFLRLTEYGSSSHSKMKNDVPEAHNLGYTTSVFPLHVDMVARQRPPGAIVLHCIEQAKGKGGENWLVDGFKVAEDLRIEDPENFKILTETVIEYYDIGDDHYGKFYHRQRHPTISMDSRGRLVQINISDHGRDAMLRIPVDRVQPFYNALSIFTAKLYDKKNVYAYKLKEGDILTIDNTRLIHGRNAFDTNMTSSRNLEIGYFDWDELNSRLRVIHKQLGYPTATGSPGSVAFSSPEE